MFDFSSKVVLVTGANGNLGKAVSLSFKAAHAKIIVVDHKTGRLQHTFPNWGADPNALLIENIDVSELGQTRSMVKQIRQAFGEIDILVNTVGGYQAGKPLHLTDSITWELMLNLNAGSVFNVSHEVIPVMLEQGSGKIINVAAASALRGSANSSAYAASKSAVARLTESMAAEYGKQGLRVNAVLPSIIDTPQNRKAMPNADFHQWVTPQAIADVITFLASEKASAINGALIPVFGSG
jgi:NAD(P)-dependent dehydrogenase (short-subunit alcohol dehydrogenase family)